MITGTVTFNEFVAAQRLHSRVTNYRIFAVFGCMLILGAIFSGAGIRMVGWPLMGGALGGAAAASVRILTAGPKMKRIYSQMRLSENPTSYEWNVTQLSGSSPRAAWKKAWTEYVNIKESASLFLLYHADNAFEIIPKSWFDSETELLDFRSSASEVAK